MDIKELKIVTEKPRCEGPIMDPCSQNHRKFHGKDLRCSRQSSVSINGRSYCGQHAGVVVLELLLSRESRMANRLATIKLKGAWAKDGTEWDRGVITHETSVSVTMADNEFGTNQRMYMRGDIARIDLRD